MPIEDHLGLTGPSYMLDIERGRVRDFARAMHASVPEFMETEDPVIPATFLATAQYSWGYSLERPRGTVLEQIDHDLSVPLHASEEYIFFGPLPRAGDRLRAQTGVEAVETKTGGNGGTLTFITMLTDYRDAEGELVAEQRAVTVTTERGPRDERWNPDVPAYRPSYEGLDPEDLFGDVIRVDNPAVGDSAGSIEAGPLRIGDITRFQGVIGEDNPLHSDVAYAQANDYPTVFGLGMHQASLLAAYAAHWMDPTRVSRFKATFRDVYWPGDNLVYSGSVASVREDVVELSLSCSRKGGDPVVEVEMSLSDG